jgi:pyruvate kinase
VLEIRHLLELNGGDGISIIAKIENDEGVKHIDEIIEASDGVMIARGDMGVEIPMEEVPAIQKMIIKKVYAAGKQVITATQMLDSMIKNPRPTRAEVTDVANAIYDGTSAIMLSGETAAGAYPIEALQAMVRIAERTEADIDYRGRFFSNTRDENPDITDAICHATCTTALDLGARAILTVTKSGYAANMISSYRPLSGVVACTPSERVARQLNLSWGVTPIVMEERHHVLDLFNHAVECTQQRGYIDVDDIVVITSGVPLGHSGTTNMIKVQKVEPLA